MKKHIKDWVTGERLHTYEYGDTDFRNLNLRRANLTELVEHDISAYNFTGTNMQWAQINARFVIWNTPVTMSIGCSAFSRADWMNMGDTELLKISPYALEFRDQWAGKLLTLGWFNERYDNF